jgi:hypothetical protein
MQLVQVDVVGAQPLERLLNRDLDVVPSALGAGGRAVTHVDLLVAEFRGQHHLVAPATQDLAEREFRAALRPVHLRRVEQRDARLDRGVHHGPRAGHVEPAAEVVAAQSHYGHKQSRVTQSSIAHACIISVS